MLDDDELELCGACFMDVLEAFEPDEQEEVDNFIKRVGRKTDAIY